MSDRECSADEYEALADQLHESIATGQTPEETATMLRLLAAPSLDRRSWAAGVEDGIRSLKPELAAPSPDLAALRVDLRALGKVLPMLEASGEARVMVDIALLRRLYDFAEAPPPAKPDADRLDVERLIDAWLNVLPKGPRVAIRQDLMAATRRVRPSRRPDRHGAGDVNADCHFGDHDFERNGYCCHCGTFNAGWLAYQAHEKAERLGLTHGDHFHRTPEAKAACKREIRYPWLAQDIDAEYPAPVAGAPRLGAER